MVDEGLVGRVLDGGKRQLSQLVARDSDSVRVDSARRQYLLDAQLPDVVQCWGDDYLRNQNRKYGTVGIKLRINLIMNDLN